MIIDSHVHICGPPLNQDYIESRTADGSVIALPFRRGDCSVNRLLQDMDTNNIEMALINAFTGAVTNEQLSEVVKEHRTRLMGFAWINNPLDANESVKELEEAVNVLGLKGLKLHPGLQGFSPADPRLYPLIRQAAELSIPIFIHMFPWPLSTFDQHKPEHIYTLKKHVPDATILVGHMAYQRFLDLLILMWEPGIYVETSFGLELIASLHGIKFAERLLRRLGINRVVFGSDWMGQVERITELNMNIIEKMDLTKEEKDNILGENIRKVLESSK